MKSILQKKLLGQIKRDLNGIIGQIIYWAGLEYGRLESPNYSVNQLRGLVFLFSSLIGWITCWTVQAWARLLYLM
jgi:hypothetical protein